MNHLRSSNFRPLAKSSTTASLLTCFFSASLLLSACSQKPGDQAANVEASAPKKRELARVRTQPVEQREMRRVLVTATAIESALEVDVTPKIGGLVTEVLVEEGMAVSAGQVLVIQIGRASCRERV